MIRAVGFFCCCWFGLVWFCLSGAFNADNATVPCEVQCCFFQNDLCICVREDASAMRGAGMDPTEWPQAALTLAREDLGLGIFSAPFPPAPLFWHGFLMRPN